MPIYELWELLNAAAYLKEQLKMKFPLNIVRTRFEKAHTPTPFIVVEIKAKQIPPEMYTLKLKLDIQNMEDDSYHCKLDNIEQIETLIRGANKRACDVLNKQLKCVHDGTLPWQIYPQGKPKLGEIPHLRCYSRLDDPRLAKACLFEVMEKITGQFGIPFEEKAIIPCPRFAGKLSLMDDIDGGYYLCYQEYSLEKLMDTPMILYLYSSLAELSESNAPVYRH